MVTVIPSSSCAAIDAANNQVVLSGLPDGIHFFTIKAQTSAGKKTFAHFTVEVSHPVGSVTISSSAADQIVPALTNAVFSVSASTSGSGSLTYQWFRIPAGTSTYNALSDTGAYTGSSTATLTVAADTTMDGDSFLCLVSDGASTATSNHRWDLIHTNPSNPAATQLLQENTPAVLTVTEQAPQITSQPNNIDIRAPNAVALTVSTQGSPATFGYEHYQWQRQAFGSSTWTNLTQGSPFTNVTSSSLSILTNTGLSGDQYRCVITNTAGTVTSNAATRTVGTQAQISIQPTNPNYVLVGSNLTLSVTATGSPPLSYTWYKLGSPNTVVGSGPSLSFTNIQTSSNGNYYCAVSNAYSQSPSYCNTTVVTAGYLPAFSPQPGNKTITQGQSVTFNASISGATVMFPFTYQWNFNGSAISGASGSGASSALSYTISSAQAAAAGNYSVTVSDVMGTATSSAGTLTVNVAPAINAQPQNTSAYVGQGASFAVTATGTPSPTYQWTKNGSNISGATTSTLTLSNVQLSDAGAFAVNVSNSVGTLSSNSATLTVSKVPQLISFTGPADQAFNFAPITLSASSDSGLPITFSIPAGNAVLNNSSLTLTGTGLITVRASQAGNGTYAAAADVDQSFTVFANFDSWRKANFNAGELQNPSLSGDAAIYGQDGLPNLIKYALGLDPKQNAVSGLPNVTSNGTDWIYTYTRPVGLPDVLYSVEVSTDLLNWNTSGVIHEFVSTSGGIDTWHARYSLSTANVFFRLRVDR